jgi:hypothetical protein
MSLTEKKNNNAYDHAKYAIYLTLIVTACMKTLLSTKTYKTFAHRKARKKKKQHFTTHKGINRISSDMISKL